VSLIVVAFALNFSLFFTRVIVDAGNITANVFLSAIGGYIEPGNADDYFFVAKAFYPGSSGTDFISVASNIKEVLNPNSVLGGDTFEDMVSAAKLENEEIKTFPYVSALLITALFMFILSKHFFVAGFMFLGRIIHIIYYMVASPFFLITAFIPGFERL
jgi:hypothetical protein